MFLYSKLACLSLTNVYRLLYDLQVEHFLCFKVKFFIALANIRLGQKDWYKDCSLSFIFHYNKLACFSLAPSLTFKSKAGVSHQKFYLLALVAIIKPDKNSCKEQTL